MVRRKLAGRASLYGCSICPAEAKSRHPSGIRGRFCASLDVEDDLELRYVQIRDAGLSEVGASRARDTGLTNSLLYRSCTIPPHLPIYSRPLLCQVHWQGIHRLYRQQRIERTTQSCYCDMLNGVYTWFYTFLGGTLSPEH